MVGGIGGVGVGGVVEWVVGWWVVEVVELVERGVVGRRRAAASASRRRRRRGEWWVVERGGGGVVAGPADVDRAVAAAKAAFPKWSNLAAMERGRLLLKLADAIEANADALARLESLDTGHPIRETHAISMYRARQRRSYFAAASTTTSKAR